MPSTYDNLPVFREVYDLLLRIIYQSRKMTRDFRYTIGEDLKKAMLRLEVLIYRANAAADKEMKIRHIDEALDKIIEVKILTRLLHDSKQMNLKTYAISSEALVNIEKHLENWKKYNQK